MKCCIFFICLYSLISIGFAQDSINYDSREYIALGFKAGLNVSNIYDCSKENFNTKSKTGFAGGFFLALPVCRYFGIQPELMYSQRGFKGAGRFMGSDYDLSRTSGYLDVPLFLSFKPLEGISVLFGPQYSFLLHQHNSFSNSSLTSDQEQAFKNDNIKKHILCLSGGIDFNLANIVLGLRTGWDLTHNKDDGSGEIPRYKNIWLQGTVGFRAY